MNEIAIDAWVWGGVDAGEQAMVVAAAEQLGECLGGDGAAWPVRLDLAPAGDGGAIAVVSMLGDVLAPEPPMAEVALRWRRRAAALVAGYGVVILCNVFGFVADRERRPCLMERIRRLNHLAILLSGEFGVGVADLDRVFTVFGASECRTDYRLGGRIAAEIAGHAIVGSLLAMGIDGLVPAAVEAAAGARHGGLAAIDGLIARRVAGA